MRDGVPCCAWWYREVIGAILAVLTMRPAALVMCLKCVRCAYCCECGKGRRIQALADAKAGA